MKVRIWIVLSLLVALVVTTAVVVAQPDELATATPGVGHPRVYNEAKGETEPANYIIQLTDDPIATYKGGISGLAATSPLVTGDRKLDSQSPDSLAYEQYLADKQDQFAADMNNLLGRNVNISFYYRHAYNGMAAFLSPAEAARVAEMPGVTLLYREGFEEILTDAGPTFIGAPSIWGGGLDRNYTVTLGGSQEVPPNGSTATGTGTFSYNLLTNQLTWNISHNVITPTAAHIHHAPVGVNGPVIVPLDHTVNPMVGSATLTNLQQGWLVNQELYVNIHTAAFPGGEIRGQIIPTTTVSTGTMGEGIIIGVIDTGINSGHPSFADVGGDGYDHTNPFGSGNYVGYCVANPSFCNDKLIGAWAFHPSSTNPEDADGHGSHTASTAGGNFVESPILYAPTISYTFASLSGVAPHVNIIAYQVCVPTCPTSSTTAAVNQAVIDGVDVTNYSISGGTNPYVETTAVAFLNAVAAGVFPANSAGNSGPGAGTVGHQGPWIMTVAASTHDRAILNSVVDLTNTSGTLPNILGQSPTVGYGPATLVYAGDPPYNNPLCNPFPGGTFSGEIVVCDRGVIGRVEKGQNVLNAGGGGMVLANDVNSAASLNDDTHVLPATHISYADGVGLKAWMAAGTGDMGRITGGTVDYDAAYGDNMASFSSRGPAGGAVPGLANLIKPDVSTPGLNILAAYRAGFTTPPEYNIISGTSMASPHAAGSAALIRAMHPTWTPTEVKSALMMTGITDLDKEDNSTPADPFDLGAGRLDLTTAGDVGFVLDITNAEYVAANPATSGDPKLLNLPSMANSDCAGTCSWTRTLRSVLSTSQEYDASLTLPTGVTGTVTPANFTIPAGGTQVITIELDVTGATLGNWTFASVHIEPVTSPFAGGGSASFTSTPSVAIPDNTYDGSLGSMVCDTIDASSIPAGATISDVTIEQIASHTWVGDMTVKLETPDGTVLALMERPQGDGTTNNTGDNGTDTPFGDSSNFSTAFPISYNDAYLDNPEQMGLGIGTGVNVCEADNRCQFYPNPDQALVVGNSVADFAALAGENASGNWRLCMADSAGGDTGTFQEWTLTVDYTGGGGGVPAAHMPVAVIPAEAPQAPIIDVDPTSLTSTQAPDTVVSETLTISNLGDVDLDWDIFEDSGQSNMAGFWSDDFDSYPTGQNMHGVGGWKGWDNSPAATAFTTAAQAQSAPNSVDIAGASDLVQVYTGATSGLWTYTAWQYVPSSMTGLSYFIMLNTYNDGGPYNWSVQVSFDAAANVVTNDGNTGGTLALIEDQWVELRVEIDLDADTQEFYYNNQLLYSGTWTAEQAGGGVLNIGAVDLYANSATSVYYDDLSLVGVLGECAVPGDITWASVSPSSGSTAPSGSSDVNVAFDSTGLAVGSYEATLCVESNDPVTPIVPVPLTLNVEEPVDVPVIEVDPLALESSQIVSTVVTHTLTISNVGTGDLDWTIDEEAPAVNVPIGGDPQRQGVPAPRTTPVNLDSFSGPIVADGGFEAGTPNPFWNEASTNFGTPLCDAACGLGGGTGPHSGSWWAWFGGIAAYEEGSVDQDITIPNGTATLSFWLEVPQACANTTDYVEVLIDGNQEFLVDGNSPLCGVVGYSLQTVDISAYADGGVHNLEFHSEIFGGGTTNFFVDDVSIDIGGPPPVCSTLTDIPWASVSPTSGTTAGGDSSDVMVTFDATGLTVGNTYTGTLCVNSNDPVTPLVTVPLTLTVEAQSFGVEVAAEDADLSGEPDTTVMYTVWVTNTGNVEDSFDLTAVGIWNAAPSVASVTLGAGESTSVMVHVDIPADAEDAETDVTTFTATSQSDATATASVDLTTTAVVVDTTVYIYLPIILKP